MKHGLWILIVAAATTNAAISAELSPAPSGSFSVVVIPDTQHYRERDSKDEHGNSIENPTFEAYADWAAANIERQRIVFVSHVGDIVDRNEKKQWRVARLCMDRLHGKTPYGISVGNHDMTAGGDSSLFQEYFPRKRFASFDWYGGCYTPKKPKQKESANNANSYQLFSAGGLDFVFLHLECNAPDKVLEWADDILKRYSNRHALVTTHMGLGPRDRPKFPEDFFEAPKGRMNWSKIHGKDGNSPQEMWDKCFRKHGNLFMICSGDQSRTQTLTRESRGDRGNRVFELLSDYGVHGLRVMRFTPRQKRIDVVTWDPIKGKLCESTKIAPERSRHQFRLPFPTAILSSSDNSYVP